MNVPLKLVRSDDREIVFESRVGRNWIFVGLGIPMVAVAIAAQGPGRLGARIGFLAVGSLLAWAGVTAALWRERLVLDVLGRQFRRDRGYVWQIGTQTGSLDEVEAIALSTELRGGGRSGTYTVFVVEVRFREPLEAVKIEGFRTEGEARELVTLLSRTLHVPFADRTVQPTSQLDWNDVGKPLAARGSKRRGGIFSLEAIPPLPPATGIEFSRAGVRPIITLPMSGFAIGPLLFIAFASVFVWIGFRTLDGMVEAMRSGAEHYWMGWVIGGLLFLTGASGVLHGFSLMLAREYVRDEGNTLVLGKRIWRLAYGKSTVAKDTVMDVAISPAQSAEGEPARMQRAMREMVPSIGNWQASVAILQKQGRQTLGVTLTTDEQQWLVAALRAMCGSNG